MTLRVLFVCLGNICRSPMAEAIFRHKVKESGLDQEIEVDSAGTGDWHLGAEPHEGTREQLDAAGISYQGMFGRQIEVSDFSKYDYIIAMDESNKSNILKLAPKESQASVIRFMELLNDKPVASVPDPYFTGRFDEVYTMISNGTDQLLKQLENKGVIK